MKRSTRAVRIVLCGLTFAASTAAIAAGSTSVELKRTPALVRQSADSVGQYQRIEFIAELPRTYENPFDPSEVSVTAAFQTPSGRRVEVPAFYYQPYARSRDADGRETLSPAGRGVFKARFAWGEVGQYQFDIRLTDADGTRNVGKGGFQVTPGKSQGYVRRSTTTPFYFRLDSGASYFAIGENMCWPGEGGTYDYDTWMGQLASHGGNYERLWLINEWNKLGLEHRSLSPGDGNGLGRYDQQAAWRIDYILEMAERLGIRVLMCIDSFNSLDSHGEYGNWNLYPYNTANGGPCASPPDFFTNAEAKRLFQQRLRYLVARWGYSTSVLAWEFWNEVDIVTGYDSASIASWHRDMARSLRSADPWAHLITTSFGDTTGDPAVDGLPEMDFVQAHSYGSKDMAGTVSSVDLSKTAKYGKPHYFGEFGADVMGADNDADPEGIHLHNGLWASMLSRSAGTAMLWWWDSYIEPKHLYDHFAPVAAFASDIDWSREAYPPAQILDLRYRPGHESKTNASLTIDPPAENWGDDAECNRPQTSHVGEDGSVSDFENLSRVQHGVVNHPTWHNPVTFQVNYPAAGTFEVGVAGVSGYGGAGLAISVDGARKLAVDFTDTRPDDTRTMRQYDRFYPVDVPAGRHTIVVEDTGADWFCVSYRLTNYLTAPNLRVLGLSNANSGILWVQNRENTWWNHRNRVSSKPVDASEIELGGFTPGDYRIEQWDTYSGRVTGSVPYTSTGGTIVLTTPAGLTTDVAYKIRRAQ